MLVTPAARALRILRALWACAATGTSWAAASRTITDISSMLRPSCHGVSWGLQTPPLAITLMTPAPLRMTSRVARRASAGPSVLIETAPSGPRIVP